VTPVLPSSVRAVTATLLDELDRRAAPGPEALLLHGSLCWGGELSTSSDVDVVVLWPALPAHDALEAAHLATLAAHPDVVVDGFHATAGDLAGPPTAVGRRPVFHLGRFDPAGTLDLNWPTWHELAERGIAVRGTVPPVHTDHAALLATTRDNLDTYWRRTLGELETLDEVPDSAVTWAVLGVARLHHLLATGSMTSKSGAGRYVLASLDERWHPVAAEALRLRESPATTSAYADRCERGRDVVAFLRWAVADGVAR
jgi:hypothetical protein